MFTGLIQAVGRVNRRGNTLQIEGCEALLPLNLGDSVAVDGVCLTVSSITGDRFLADISEETLERTTLGQKANQGGYVNLEPALRLSDRLGGHLVSGHVDGVGEVVCLEAWASSWNLEVCMKDLALGHYICDKASIAINGISLTIAKSSNEGTRFSIAVIPHTWSNTSLHHLAIGDLVNLEIDLMAKYAERLMKPYLKPGKILKDSPKDITKEWLINQGWT